MTLKGDSEKDHAIADDKLLARLEKLQDRFEILDIARQWAALLEKVMDLRYDFFHHHAYLVKAYEPPSLTHALTSQQTLSPSYITSTFTPPPHHPTLSALHIFRQLHALVEQMVQCLPPSLTLVDIARTVRDETWQGIKSSLAR